MFGERFKKERKKLGLTQQQIADKLGISRSNVANWENGVNEASNEMLSKCSMLFECSTDYLLGNSSIRNLKEIYDKYQGQLENDILIVKSLDKDISSDLDLNSFYTCNEPSKMGDNIEIPKSNEEILLEKLRELKLFDDTKVLTQAELNVILEFIKNNKDMLKTLINKESKNN